MITTNNTTPTKSARKPYSYTSSTVYYIICSANNRKYIGSVHGYATARKASHFCKLRNGSHPNKALQADYNKYGRAAFDFRVIVQSDTIDPISLVILEMAMIADNKNCYNRNKKASPVSAATRAKISAANTRIPEWVKSDIIKLAKKGVPNKQIAAKYGISVSYIYQIIGAENN